MNTLDIARGYLKRGWAPVPIPHGKKGPVMDEWQLLTITPENVAQYFNGGLQNIGVQFGPKSKGLADVDLDCPEALRLAHYFLPETGAVFGRPSKPCSHHLYRVKAPEPLSWIQHKDENQAIMIELRLGAKDDKGAQTMFPGSQHPGGELLEWVKNGEPCVVPYAALANAVRGIAVASLLLRHWNHPGAHDGMLRVGGFLARAGITDKAIGELIKIVAHEAGASAGAVKNHARTAMDSAAAHARGEQVYGLTGLQEYLGKEVANAVAKILKYREAATVTIGEMTAPEFSEEALALQFAGDHANDLRYVAKWNRWLRWDGARWKFDDTREAFTLARDVCRAQAARANKNAKSIASAKTRAAVVSLAGEDRDLAATVDQWDRDPWLLNTPGGVIDLKTGESRAARPDDYMTKITAIAPDSKCPTPIWNGHLDLVTRKDEDLQAFHARVFGYSLTGITTEHAMFFDYGVGANGKGVTMKTVTGIMGDYARAAPIETFTESKTDRHPTELAMLRGARMVTAAETEEGRRWAESKIKMLTGGDTISARFMRQDFFEFTPQFKLIISGNHKPGLRSVDEAIRRRLHLIPWNVVIPPKDRDPELASKLKEEWPGILAWMIAGCIEWQKIGLAPPKAVMDATGAYLEAEDAFAAWIDDEITIDTNGWEKTTALFANWKSYAEKTGGYIGSMKRMVQNLETRGFAPMRKNPDGRGIKGIKFVVPF